MLMKDRNRAEPRSIRDYLMVLRAHWLLIAFATLAAAGAALAYSLTKSPTYEAKASLSFKDPAQDAGLAGGTPVGSSDPSDIAAAGAQTVTRPAVLGHARRALGIREPVKQIQKSISTNVDPVSNLVTVTASTGNAPRSARLANAVARATKQVSARETQKRYLAAARRVQNSKLNNGSSSGLDRQLQQQRISNLISLSAIADPVQVQRLAEVPGAPASPKPVRDTLFAALIGLILGCILAFVRDALDQRLRSPEELAELDLPMVVGSVRNEALGIHLYSRNGSTAVPDQELESFRILRGALEFISGDEPPSTVVVTSPMAQEGKSSVAACLACASALAGKQTLLVESDLRRPVLAPRLGAAPAPGLADFLAGHIGPQEMLQVIQLEHPAPVSGNGSLRSGGTAPLVFISAGGHALRPGELLGSQQFADFLAEVADAYDMVVLDSSPLLPVVDTQELLPLVDAVLLCVRLGQTTRDQASAAMGALGLFPARPTGLVVTGTRPGAGSYYGYYSSREAGASVVR